MDRLTMTPEGRKREGLGPLKYLSPAMCAEYDKRLTAYEDTGLTPAEIVAMREELQKAKQQIADNSVFMAAHGAGGHVFDTRADQVPTNQSTNTQGTPTDKPRMCIATPASDRFDRSRFSDPSYINAPVADNPATGNRPLTLDEVLALPEGARVWVELSRKSYFNSEMHTFSAAENRSIAEIREPRLTDMSGGWFPINADWVNDEYRVWSLPQEPTPEELAANPWPEAENE